MPKLTRITNKIFGQNATAIGDNPQIGQFGSAKAGTYIGTTDVETIQELPAWSNGWVDAVTPQNQFPALPEMTAVHKVLSRQTGYLMQEGIAEYDADTTYYKGSLVKSYSDNDGIKLYFSKIDENINHSLEDTTAWEEASLGGSGGLEIGDIGTALFVDESKGKRRKLNGSIMAINDNTRGFVNWLKAVVATTPSLATTEQNWQAESALAVDGCVYKYVLDEENATVRLPKYPEYIEINVSNSTVPVKGNGMTLGLTDGNNNYGMWVSGNTENRFLFYTGAYGTVIGSASASGSIIGDHYKVGITTDSSKSGVIADTSNVLKQTKLKLYYFIQIATGSETQVNIINEIELNNPYTLFDSKYSDHQIFNLSWLRSNGSYYSKAVYVTAYEALQAEYNSQITVGSTVTLPSGTQYTKQGLSVKLSTGTFANSDFVLSTSDETFRLPINQQSEYLYYYVGETVQNANLIDAGRIQEQLANKVDTSNTQWATNACMPDYSAGINISVPKQSAPYICQYDCYMQGISYKTYYAGFYVYINGAQYQLGSGNGSNMFQSNNINLFLPKGTSIYFNDGYVAAITLYVFPLKGVN